MKLRTVTRHGKQGIKNLGRNGWMTFASVSSVTVALLLVGYFLALMLNLNFLASQMEDDVEVRVYIERTATDAQKEELRREIEEVPHVSNVTYLSKAEGLENLMDSLSRDGKRSSVIASLRDENPLPDAYVIQADEPRNTIDIAKSVKPFDYVGDVNYGQGTVEQLFQVTNVARNIGVALVIGLLFTALFLIGNTIKLTIVSRRREIEIMKLVGATNSFIRWPFFVEGLILGTLGSVVPITLLILGYRYIYDLFNAKFATLFIEMIPPNPSIFYLSAGLLAVGAIIGVWGSVNSVRKFLKV
jgi:cell division transport system permease protein